MRHARQTSSAPYKLYVPHPLDIHMLQASILNSIQQITDFTYQDDVSILAIRLLVKCVMTLETIERGLNVTLPGSEYKYYREFFRDYEDVICQRIVRTGEFKYAPSWYMI